jgi:stage II sporulation protein R
MIFTLSSCHVDRETPQDKFVRFHVIANSDSPEDQRIKLMVRDRVLKDIGPKLENCKTKAESEYIINQNIETIKKIAEDELKDNGVDSKVAVSLGKSIFPAKIYSGVMVPEGEYDALKVIIGDGEGKNWWCVMFPPLCFIDVTKGITSEEAEHILKKAINTSSELDKEALNTKAVYNEKGSSKQKNIEIKFKTVEIFKSLISKLEEMLSSK